MPAPAGSLTPRRRGPRERLATVLALVAHRRLEYCFRLVYLHGPATEGLSLSRFSRVVRGADTHTRAQVGCLNLSRLQLLNCRTHSCDFFAIKRAGLGRFGRWRRDPETGAGALPGESAGAAAGRATIMYCTLVTYQHRSKEQAFAAIRRVRVRLASASSAGSSRAGGGRTGHLRAPRPGLPRAPPKWRNPSACRSGRPPSTPPTRSLRWRC